MNASIHTGLGPGVAAGVTEPMIHDLVYGFYAEVRADPALGPIFDREIGQGWDEHLNKMCDFWSSVLLMTGRFKGAPMVVHAGIAEIEAAHFTRWLLLFRQAAEKGLSARGSGALCQQVRNHRQKTAARDCGQA